MFIKYSDLFLKDDVDDLIINNLKFFLHLIMKNLSKFVKNQHAMICILGL